MKLSMMQMMLIQTITMMQVKASQFIIDPEEVMQSITEMASWQENSLFWNRNLLIRMKETEFMNAACVR